MVSVPTESGTFSFRHSTLWLLARIFGRFDVARDQLPSLRFDQADEESSSWRDTAQTAT